MSVYAIEEPYPEFFIPIARCEEFDICFNNVLRERHVELQITIDHQYL